MEEDHSVSRDRKMYNRVAESCAVWSGRNRLSIRDRRILQGVIPFPMLFILLESKLEEILHVESKDLNSYAGPEYVSLCLLFICPKWMTKNIQTFFFLSSIRNISENTIQCGNSKCKPAGKDASWMKNKKKEAISWVLPALSPSPLPWGLRSP